MMSAIKNKIKKISGYVFRPQVGVFLIFLAIASTLWFVSSLNDVVQRQVVYNLRITNVPDSVTFINNPPQTITVSVVGRGSHMLRHLLGSRPTINLNFRKFQDGDRFVVSHTALAEIIQSRMGDERKIQEIYPDTIGFYFTTRPPVRLPVRVAVTASTTPSVHIYGNIQPEVDTVSVYGSSSALQKVHYISTDDVRFSRIDKDARYKVPLIAPPGCKVVPDSVYVNIKVEPYVIKDKKIKIQSIEVPFGYEMVTVPSELIATYRVARSQGDDLPEIKIYADYKTITNQDSGYVRIYKEPNLSSVFLPQDSVYYYIYRVDEQ